MAARHIQVGILFILGISLASGEIYMAHNIIYNYPYCYAGIQTLTLWHIHLPRPELAWIARDLAVKLPICALVQLQELSWSHHQRVLAQTFLLRYARAERHTTALVWPNVMASALGILVFALTM